MSEQTALSREMHIVEAGRWLMAQQLAVVQGHWSDLTSDSSETAVHETRKAIRRTFTLFKLLAPYDDEPLLAYYRRGLRKMMRRLGRCRDIAIFGHNLDAFALDSGHDDAEMASLAHYWQDQQAAADVSLRAYLEQPKVASFLAEYAHFVQTPVAVATAVDEIVPVRVKHLLPVLVQQRLAAVLAFEDVLSTASYAQLHRLRVQFKELRYTLGFFAPLLDAAVMAAVEAHLDAIQDHLGALNDAHIALLMLAQTPGRETAVAAYQTHCQQTAHALEQSFPALWHTFNNHDWRRELVTAVNAI